MRSLNYGWGGGFLLIRHQNGNCGDLKVEEQEQGSVVSLSKEEQQRDRRTKMVKRGVFERGKLQVRNICDITGYEGRKFVYNFARPETFLKLKAKCGLIRNYILDDEKSLRQLKGG